ncbi:MAG TPA: M50 family metallopeptidase [Chloroflexota bacterium]|nr:M50 family metallopeptidase [Chloroflexota bacterium]
MSLQVLAIIPILSLLMFVHELGHFLTARRAGIVVQEFGFGLPPRIFGIKRNGVIYSLNWIPFGAFVKMLGEEDPSAPGSFASKSRLTRAMVLIAGSGMNFLTAGVVFALAFASGWPSPIENEVEVAQVAPDSPAETAGLLAGDIVLEMNGKPITRVDDFRQITRDGVGTAIDVRVQRADQIVNLTVTPRSNPPQGQGAVGVAIRPPIRAVRHNPIESVLLGFARAVAVVGFTLAAPVLVIQGIVSPDMLRPIGLPGMAQVASQAVDFASDTGFIFPILTVTATFSAGLAIANMLPLPALDGGRLFFILVEAVRGRRINPERESLFHFVGIVVLITLMVLISLNDIQNPLPTIDWGVR